MRRIYLDHNASTPVAPEVVAAMRPFLDGAHGNPSSGHWAGQSAREAVEQARAQIASLLACAGDEVVFTSGGSEANNHALKGVAFALRDKGDHIVTSAIEHPATLVPCQHLVRLGYKITYVPVDTLGRVDPEDVRRALTPRTILVSIMHANNEVGTIEPIEAISRITRERGIALHTDAAQSVGKIPTRVDELGVDLLSMAGHKLYAPKGVGALYIRRGTPIEPLIHGAAHESGRRAGTESALMAVALGTAAALAADPEPMARMRVLRDHFWRQLQSALGNRVALNGHPEQRLPNTLNVSFIGRIGAEVLAALEGVAASTGSACHSGRIELSPVLEAMGVAPEIGMGAVRFSLGRGTTRAEVDAVVARIGQAFAASGRRGADMRRTTRRDLPPILADKHYEEASAFVPENLLREARRQKGLNDGVVPDVCVLDPDGDIVRQARSGGRAIRDPDWACYHTALYRLTRDGLDLGIVPCAVGASFAVLVAEQLFAAGCRLLVSVTSSGQLADLRPPPYFILIERSLRDEGTSYHYLRASEFSMANPSLIGAMDGAFEGLRVAVERGATWTTDAPFRETPAAIAAMKSKGLLAVEMEAAALYAFAEARARPVLCFAHVTNRMARIEGDFEKGEADGSIDALAVIVAAAKAWREIRP